MPRPAIPDHPGFSISNAETGIGNAHAFHCGDCKALPRGEITFYTLYTLQYLFRVEYCTIQLVISDPSENGDLRTQKSSAGSRWIPRRLSSEGVLDFSAICANNRPFLGSARIPLELEVARGGK